MNLPKEVNEMIKHIEKYSDEYGVTHLYPNPTIYGSQNGPMYSGLTWLLYTELYHEQLLSTWVKSNRAIYALCSGACQTTPGEEGTPGNFSHDNMTGIVVWRKAVGIKQKITPYNFKQWWHPRDVSFYLYARFPYIFWPLLLTASVAMIVSCAQDYKYRNGKQILKTDGKILTFMRCRAFYHNPILRLTFKICTHLIRKNEKFSSWTNIMNIYFKDKDHPVNKMIETWEAFYEE